MKTKEEIQKRLNDAYYSKSKPEFRRLAYLVGFITALEWVLKENPPEVKP